MYEEIKLTAEEFTRLKRENKRLKKCLKKHKTKLKSNKKFNTIKKFNLWNGKKYKSNILEYPKESKRYHPTQKPVKLLEDLIKTYTDKGDLVLDFTMGSGSTGVACMNTGRRFIGIEQDPEYYNIAVNRMKNRLI